MTKQTLRNTIIDLLDDENGVNEAGYNGIDEICLENNWQDILTQVDGTDGRFYLGEDEAEELRKVVVED